MTLNKRGSRRIAVDGVAYRWTTATPPLSFEVERTDAGRHATLVVQLEPSAQVLPSTVANAVREALDRGWRPDRQGPPFVLEISVADDGRRP